MAWDELPMARLKWSGCRSWHLGGLMSFDYQEIIDLQTPNIS